jgi:hypothetical protein
MPYIKQEDRGNIEDLTKSPTNAGELNYLLHLIISNYVDDNKESYQTYNDIIGVLECVKQELYRRKIAPYEEKKIIENGDIDFYEGNNS